MRLSIGSLSKAFNLSDEAIRYYERKGLLSPKREAGKGYRQYDRVDIQRISNIKRMQALGFSLDQIWQAYQGLPEEKLTALYQNKLTTLENQLAYQTRVYEHLKKVTSLLQAKNAWLFKPRLVKREKAFVRAFPSIPDMWEAARRDKVLKTSFHHQPLVSFSTFFEISDGQLQMPVLCKGVAVFASDAAVLPFALDGFAEIDATTAVEMVFRLENGRFDLPRLMQPLASYLTEHRLEAVSPFFTHKLFDYRDETGCVVHYARLIVPIRPR